MVGKLLENVREKHPLIHNITNYVTVNDCANITLACGASPIMADAPEEAADITSISQGLNINIGTLNSAVIKAMLIAGRKANEIGNPVVLDPVGVGASQFRNKTATELLDNISFSVIRGNVSEIKSLVNGSGNTNGVDASDIDRITEDNLAEAVELTKKYAEEIHSVIAITGEIDIITDGRRACCVRNGNAIMSSITGTGCQLSSLIAAFAAANPENVFEATAAAVCAMGLAGEIGAARMNEMDGNSTYRNYIIDAIYNMTSEQLEEGAKNEMY